MLLLNWQLNNWKLLTPSFPMESSYFSGGACNVGGATRTRRVINGSLKAGLTIVLATGELDAQPPRPRTRQADVSIVVQADGRAAVQARYEFTGDPGALSFEMLQQRCAVVGSIRLQSNGVDVPFAREATGPWLRLHDTTAVDSDRDSLGYTLAYDVELLARDVSIPVLLPVAILRGSGRGALIANVTATLPPGARVTVPRMAHGAAGRWSARMVALPAAVRVHVATPNADCEPSAAGDSGSFKIIFWSLVTTLALWVPLYLWWANRQRHTG